MTVVDSSYAIMAGFNYVAEHEGLPKVSHELVMENIAAPMVAYCEALLGEYRPEWLELYREGCKTFDRELIKPFDDTIPTLTKLKSMGIKVAVASNREKPSQALERTGLSKYFDVIVGAEEPFGILPYKPNPAMLNEIMKYFNINLDDTVYVGDSDVDILTAMASNVRGIGITKGTFTREDFNLLGAWKVIDGLGELIEIVKSDNADLK